METKAKVLAVDDEEQIRTYLRKVLEKENHDIIEAPDGKVALRLFQEVNPDLIIIDLIMPEKEGLETIMELKHNFKDVKIIAISGGWSKMGPDYLLNMAKTLGAIYTIKKPFKNTEIVDAVERVLKSP